MTDPVPSRLSREKAFHDARYAVDSRAEQDSFYITLSNMVADYNRLIRLHAHGRDTLEYGCGRGERAIDVAKVAKSFTGIDISAVAVEKARERAVENRIRNAEFIEMNAEAMTFTPERFDFIYGSGILHHLSINRACWEIARVLRPGGKALFVEPLGHNSIINAYRSLTPNARTEDEHPLMRSDFVSIEGQFSQSQLRFYGLSTLAAIPFRRRAFAKPLIRICQRVDDALLRLPLIRWQAWYCLMLLTK